MARPMFALVDVTIWLIVVCGEPGLGRTLQRPASSPAAETAACPDTSDTHQGRGRHICTVITEINRFTRGWVGYFRRSTVKHQFEGRDQWTRRRWRKMCGRHGAT